MKILIRQKTVPSKVHFADSDNSNDTNNSDTDKNKNVFNYVDLVNILEQINELSDFNIGISTHDSILRLTVGDSVYEISDRTNKQYPRRRLRKLET